MNGQENTAGEDTTDSGNGLNGEDPLPTPKMAGMKRTSTAAPRQPTRKKPKHTSQKKKKKGNRPVAKASKFVVATNQTHLDIWAKKFALECSRLDMY